MAPRAPCGWHHTAFDLPPLTYRTVRNALGLAASASPSFARAEQYSILLSGTVPGELGQAGLLLKRPCRVAPLTQVPRGAGAGQRLGESTQQRRSTSQRCWPHRAATDTSFCPPPVSSGSCRDRGAPSGPGPGRAVCTFPLGLPAHVQTGELGPGEAKHLVQGRGRAGTGMRLPDPRVGPRSCELFRELAGMFTWDLWRQNALAPKTRRQV